MAREMANGVSDWGGHLTFGHHGSIPSSSFYRLDWNLNIQFSKMSTLQHV